MHSLRERMDCVWQWVDAAARVKNSIESYESELSNSTGLSIPGIRYAVARALEVDPSESDVLRLVERTSETPHVTVVLSAHVFTAPLRAIAIAAAAAPRVVVRPSRREPVFTRALVDHLSPSARAQTTVVSDLDLSTVRAGEIHAYGQGATIDAIRAQLPPGVHLRAHGPGFGVALVTASCGAAAAIASDVVMFDQRGCLSPRFVMCVDTSVSAISVAQEIDVELTRMATSIPLGQLDNEEREGRRAYMDAMVFAGATVFERASHAVVAGAPINTLPPTGRVLHVTSVSEQWWTHLGTLAPYVTCIGTDDPSCVPEDLCKRTRVCALGAMQSPPLDGPVDVRDVGQR